MSSPSKRHCSSDFESPDAGSHSPPSEKKVRHSPKDTDWSEVTNPEERRRIQNRIAQRKFREKARENKEKTERESRNQEHAGNSYRIPTAADFSHDNELSGVPWGGLGLGHFAIRGLEAESRRSRSSGRGTFVGTDDSYQSPMMGGGAIVYPNVVSYPRPPPFYANSAPEVLYSYAPPSGYVYSPAMPVRPYPSRR